MERLATEEDKQLASDIIYLSGARDVMLRRFSGAHAWLAFWLLTYFYTCLVKDCD